MGRKNRGLFAFRQKFRMLPIGIDGIRIKDYRLVDVRQQMTHKIPCLIPPSQTGAKQHDIMGFHQLQEASHGPVPAQDAGRNLGNRLGHDLCELSLHDIMKALRNGQGGDSRATPKHSPGCQCSRPGHPP